MELDYLVPVGKFVVRSGRLLVCDPCYDREQGIKPAEGSRDDDSLTAEFPARNGTWWAYVQPAGEPKSRVKRLVAMHVSAIAEIRRDSFGARRRETIHEELGVDSGQMSIVDPSCRPDKAGEHDDPRSWYRKVCDAHESAEETDDGVQAATFEGGCVSSTGWGDGAYPCVIERDADGNVTGVQVTFMEK